MLYRGMDRAQLDTAYNNSAAVTNYNAIKADWHARSARVRQSRRGHLDLEYGDTPRQHLDPFDADSPRALVGDTRNTFCPPATFHWAFFPRTDPYVQLSRIRFPPWVSTATMCCRMRASICDTLMRR